MMDGTKDTNPKDIIAGAKVPLSLCPDTLIAAVAMSFVEGSLKYGRFNWRAAGARTSVYLDAMQRHMKAYEGGEEIDPDSGLPHLWKAAACLAILIDSAQLGVLTDDRPPRSDVAEVLRSLEPVVKSLQAKYKDKPVKHYTIKDAKHVSAPETPR
jgi:hypothetical protein